MIADHCGEMDVPLTIHPKQQSCLQCHRSGGQGRSLCLRLWRQTLWAHGYYSRSNFSGPDLASSISSTPDPGQEELAQLPREGDV